MRWEAFTEFYRFDAVFDFKLGLGLFHTCENISLKKENLTH